MALHTMNRTFVLVASVLLAATGHAQESTTAAVPLRPRVTATSSTGRFLVTAPDSAKASEYTRWAESLADRFERVTGTSVEFTRETPLRLVLAAPGATEGLAVRCSAVDGRLCYALYVNEYLPLDYEDLLAAYCRVMTASAVDRHRRGASADGASGSESLVPDWLAVGLAQNLDASLRNRDRRLAGSWIPLSQRPDVTRVLTWDQLPESWYRTRAMCGMAVLWVVSLKPQGQAWPLMIERLASAQRLTPAWIASSLCGIKPGPAFERAWTEWMDHQERLIQDLGALTTVLVEQLRQSAETPASELREVPGLDQGDRLTPRQLIAIRKQPSVRLASEVRAQQVQALTVGRASELAAVGRSYALFFEGVAGGSWSMTLRRRLGRAERDWERLASRTRAQEAYLDDVEQELGRPAGGGEMDGKLEPLLDKSRIEAYLDQAERRFGQPGGEQAGKARREGSTGDEQGTEKHAKDDSRPH